jgi:hypothetical protein
MEEGRKAFFTRSRGDAKKGGSDEGRRRGTRQGAKSAVNQSSLACFAPWRETCLPVHPSNLLRDFATSRGKRLPIEEPHDDTESEVFQLRNEVVSADFFGKCARFTLDEETFGQGFRRGPETCAEQQLAPKKVIRMLTQRASLDVVSIVLLFSPIPRFFVVLTFDFLSWRKDFRRRVC